MEEKDLQELLGTQVPPGEKEQEAAGPAVRSDPPAEDPSSPGETGRDREESGGERPAQTREERARFAARRRKAEREAAVREAVDRTNRDNRRQWERFLQAANIPNPARGGAALRDPEELEEYLRWQDAAAIAEKARQGPGAEAEIQAAIDRRSRERAGDLARQYARQAAEAEEKVRDQLSRIRAMDPSVRSLGDLLSGPDGGRFRRYVEKGNDFVDAYYLATRDRRERQAAEEAARQGANARRSKNHLTSARAQGDGALAEVPAQEMALFRGFLPEARPSEIRAYYTRYLNR